MWVFIYYRYFYDFIVYYTYEISHSTCYTHYTIQFLLHETEKIVLFEGVKDLWDLSHQRYIYLVEKRNKDYICCLGVVGVYCICAISDFDGVS